MIEIEHRDLSKVYYLSGPMSGYPNYNFDAFQRTVDRLRPIGFKIVSPHEVSPPDWSLSEKEIWTVQMAKCREQMALCNAAIMLRGWPESRGALIELDYALEHKWPIYLYLENPGRLIRMSRPINA